MKLIIKEDISHSMKALPLLAGWPGMGNVGLTAVQYIRTKVGAQPFAEIDSSDYFTPDAVVVERGLVKFPEMPSNTFYYSRDPRLIFFEGEAQIHGAGGIEMMNTIFKLSEQLEVNTFFTGAAFALPISHREPVRVLGVANQKGIRDSLLPHGVSILDSGQISGLNGLLLGFAGLRNIPAACLLATIPRYAIELQDPKASREIVRVLLKLLEFQIDLRQIDRAAAQMDQSMAKIEKQIQMAFTERKAEAPEEDWQKVEDDRVPQYVMEKIEQLFRTVQSDPSTEKASRLKAELDRWNLYNHYEDRFLNLFRKDFGEL